MNNDDLYNDFKRVGTASNMLWGNTSAWEADALPLRYACDAFFHGGRCLRAQATRHRDGAGFAATRPRSATTAKSRISAADAVRWLAAEPGLVRWMPREKA